MENYLLNPSSFSKTDRELINSGVRITGFDWGSRVIPIGTKFKITGASVATGVFPDDKGNDVTRHWFQFETDYGVPIAVKHFSPLPVAVYEALKSRGSYTDEYCVQADVIDADAVDKFVSENKNTTFEHFEDIKYTNIFDKTLTRQLIRKVES